MAFIQADADMIRAAIATGAREVRYADGRLVAYRNLAEMRRILADIEAEIAGNVETLADNRVATGMASGVRRGAASYGWPYPGRLIP